LGRDGQGRGQSTSSALYGTVALGREHTVPPSTLGTDHPLWRPRRDTWTWRWTRHHPHERKVARNRRGQGGHVRYSQTKTVKQRISRVL